MKVRTRGERSLTPIQLVDSQINLLEVRRAAITLVALERYHALKCLEVIDGYFDDIWGFRYAPSRCFRPEIGLIVDVHGGEEIRHQKWEEVRRAQCRRLRTATTVGWEVCSTYGAALDIEYQLAILYELRHALIVERRAQQEAQAKVQVDPSLILVYPYL